MSRINHISIHQNFKQHNFRFIRFRDWLISQIYRSLGSMVYRLIDFHFKHLSIRVFIHNTPFLNILHHNWVQCQKYLYLFYCWEHQLKLIYLIKSLLLIGLGIICQWRMYCVHILLQEYQIYLLNSRFSDWYRIKDHIILRDCLFS